MYHCYHLVIGFLLLGLGFGQNITLTLTKDNSTELVVSGGVCGLGAGDTHPYSDPIGYFRKDGTLGRTLQL